MVIVDFNDKKNIVYILCYIKKRIFMVWLRMVKKYEVKLGRNEGCRDF